MGRRGPEEQGTWGLQGVGKEKKRHLILPTSSSFHQILPSPSAVHETYYENFYDVEPGNSSTKREEVEIRVKRQN